MADTDYTETTAPASSPPSLPYDPDPVTPTDPPASTPALASPTTPYHIQGMGGTEHLQTPAAPVVEGAKTAEVGIGGKNGTGGARKRGLTIVDIGDLGPAEEGVGLGFGDVGVDELEMEDVYGNKSHPVSTGAAMGQLAQRRHLEAGASRSETPEADVGFPDAQALAKMQHRLDELEAGSQSADASPAITELSQMVKSLLNPATKQLPFLNEQIAAQRETIKTLQAQAKLSDKLVKIERERHAAERQSWRVTLNALTRQRETEIASGSRPKGLLDVDMGYHEELEAANKRLEMDNRLMGPRLADTQQQVDRLVAELRHLRSHVVLSTDPFTATAQETGAQLSMGQGGAPTTPILADPFTAPPTLPRSRSPIKPITGLNGLGLKGGSASMGDARTEHLLLAARKVRVMRLANPGVGQLTMDELKRNGIKGPDGGLGYKEGYPGAMDSAEEEVDELADDSDLDETPYGVGPPVRSQSRARAQAGDASKRRRASWSGKRQRGTTATPVARSRGGRNEEESLTAVANTRPRKPKAPVTPSSKRGPRQAPHTTPGGNFDDLLRAAELATRPTTPTRETGNSKGAGVLGHRASHSHSIGHPPMSLPAGAMSATRSTNRRARERSEEADRDGDGSPRKARRVGSVGRGAPEGQHGPGGWRTGHGPRVLSGGSTTSTSGGGEKSALDLLLQASQIESRNDEVRQSAQTATEGGAQVQQVGSGGLEPAFEFRDGELMVDSRSSSVPIGGDDDGTPRAAQPTSAAQGSSIGVDGPSGKGVGSMSRPSRPAPIDVQATAAGVAADHGGVAAQGSDRTRALRQGTPLVPVTQTQQYPSSSTAAGANVHTPARPWVRMPDSSPFDDTARLPAGARSANPGVLDPISYQMLQAQHQAQHSSPAQTQTQTPRTSVPNHGPVGQGTAGEGANGNGIGNGAAVAKTPVTKGGNGPPFDSPTGVAVPGLGKYAHLTSSMPARRVRSPYLKWTVEEDELLARAVAIHGEKWDLVSKGVPTRSYHQVRQRWLRKTGAFDKKGITPISTPATTPARPHILSNQPQHFDPVLTSDQMQTQNQGKTVAPSLINGVGSGMLGSASRRGSKESVGDDEELAEGAMQRSNSPTPAEGARAGKGRRGSLSLA